MDLGGYSPPYVGSPYVDLGGSLYVDLGGSSYVDLGGSLYVTLGGSSYMLSLGRVGRRLEAML